MKESSTQSVNIPKKLLTETFISFVTHHSFVDCCVNNYAQFHLVLQKHCFCDKSFKECAIIMEIFGLKGTNIIFERKHIMENTNGSSQKNISVYFYPMFAFIQINI